MSTAAGLYYFLERVFFEIFFWSCPVSICHQEGWLYGEYEIHIENI